MTVIEQKPVPIYEVECFECKSKLHYKKSEVSNCFITCPVCGISIMVTPLRPVTLRDFMVNPTIKEEVYVNEFDTAGNTRWIGTQSGEHHIKTESEE